MKIIYPRKLLHEIPETKFLVFQQMIKCKHFLSEDYPVSCRNEGFLQLSSFFTNGSSCLSTKDLSVQPSFSVFEYYITMLVSLPKISSKVLGKLLGCNFTTCHVIHLYYSKRNSKRPFKLQKSQILLSSISSILIFCSFKRDSVCAQAGEKGRGGKKDRILSRLHTQHRPQCGAQSHDPGIMT